MSPESVRGRTLARAHSEDLEARTPGYSRTASSHWHEPKGQQALACDPAHLSLALHPASDGPIPATPVPKQRRQTNAVSLRFLNALLFR